MNTKLKEMRELLEATFSSPNDQQLLMRVRTQNTDILRYLESTRGEEIDGLISALSPDPLWIAEVYRAIVGEEQIPEDVSTALREFAAEDERELRIIAHALRDRLMPRLPSDLQNVISYFQSLTEADPRIADHLRRSLIVRESAPFGERFAHYGMTPLSVFRAAKAVSMLVTRLARRGVISRGRSICIDLENDTTRDPFMFILSRRMLHEEIVAVSELDLGASDRLLDWIVAAARSKEDIFPGYIASERQSRIFIMEAPQTFKDLQSLWKSMALSAWV